MYFRQHCHTCGFEWSDFSPLDYAAWMIGEPNNADDIEDCVTFSYSDDNGDGNWWSDDGCSKYYGYVCEAYFDQFHLAEDPWPTVGGCKNGWTQFGGACYKLFGSYQSTVESDIELPFYYADKYCNTAWPDATLAIFHNPYYQFFGTSMMDEQRRNTWIGLLVTSTNGSNSYQTKNIYHNFRSLFSLG